MKIVNLFNEALADSEEDTFLLYKSTSSSYKDVDNLSKKVEKVINLIGSGQLIALECSKYSPLLYASMVAIWRMGKTLVPISSEWSDNRKKQVLNMLDVGLVISDEKGLYDNYNYEYYLSDTQIHGTKFWIKGTSGSKDFTFVDKDLAYILFTSGTTGTPKTVPITHHNLLSYITGVSKAVPDLKKERISNFSSPVFDLFYHDLLIAWYSGGCLVPLEKNDFIHAGKLVEKLKITVWISVPSLICFMFPLNKDSQRFKSIKYSFFCGEALNCGDLRNWWELCTNSRVFNLYGPAEATIAVSIYEVDKECISTGVVPLGKLFGQTRYRIGKDPIESSEKDELLLTGPQVFSGYLNRQDSGLVKIQDELWYSTGDLVSVNNAGNLIYHGRIDRQVKINGIRVELQEMETILRNYFDYKDLYVTAAKVNNKVQYNGLNVYVVTKANTQISFSGSPLPTGVSIQSVKYIESIPRNNNGKTNYLAIQEIYENE